MWALVKHAIRNNDSMSLTYVPVVLSVWIQSLNWNCLRTYKPWVCCQAFQLDLLEAPYLPSLSFYRWLDCWARQEGQGETDAELPVMEVWNFLLSKNTKAHFCQDVPWAKPMEQTPLMIYEHTVYVAPLSRSHHSTVLPNGQSKDIVSPMSIASSL